MFPFGSWIALKSLLIALTARSLITELNDTSEVFAGVESEALKVTEQVKRKSPLIFFSLCFFPPSAGQGCTFNKFKFPELQAKL